LDGLVDRQGNAIEEGGWRWSSQEVNLDGVFNLQYLDLAATACGPKTGSHMKPGPNVTLRDTSVCTSRWDPTR
jgi:hypothetical protein